MTVVINGTTGITNPNSMTIGNGGGSVSTNTAVGASALAANTTGSGNDAFGSVTLQANTTGANNSALGRGALYSNTTGNNNAGLGYNSLFYNTTGASNTGIGNQALFSNTTASNNTAVGYQAGYTNSTGTANTFLGQTSGYSTTGSQNTLLGMASGYSTTGSGNTFVGYTAGYNVSSGSKNTIIGQYNGNQGGLDIRTASNYIVLSDGDGNPRGYFDNNGTFVVTGSYPNQYTAIFSNSSTTSGSVALNAISGTNSTATYIAYCGSAGSVRFSVYGNGGIANFQANNVNLSDRREKTNFAPAKDYLATICSIPVQTFNYIDQDLENDDGLTLGVVAQDVQAVAPELVSETNWGTQDEPKIRLSIYQTDLQYALMKAIQELNAKVDAQAAEIAALKGQA